MKYPGLELDNFDKANIWRSYIYFLIKKFIKGKVLEVGAGIGSFTENYLNLKKISSITLSEMDKDFCKILNNRYKKKKLIIKNQQIIKFKCKFDTIMYLNVLEHIKKDQDEIKSSLKKLNHGGHLVILVPAHQEIYSEFDKAVGHIKRYDINFFKKLKKNYKIVFLKQIDLIGYFLYFLNKIFFKNEVYPTKLKIFIWDKIFTPLTIVIDFLTFRKFGKNILCIIKK